ncbi:MAG: uroporphyrinogen decarboxylase family protein [Vulcanimicrobiota bacterium]
MNSMERIQATLAGKPLDRRAIVPVLSLYGARLTDCPLEQYYTDPAAYAHGQSAVRETFQPDVLCAPMAFALIGAAFGSKVHSFADQAPNIRHPLIRSRDEWENLVYPDLDTHPQLLFFRKAIRLMTAEHNGQVPVAAVLPPPVDLPALIMGMEVWLETVLFDADGTQLIMEKVIPFFVRLANSLLDDGAMFIDLPCSFASSAIVTRTIAADFARPALTKALTQLKGPVVLHHGGAPILPHLDLLMGLPSTIGFALDHRDNPGQVRHVVGPNPVVLAGPCGPDLGRMTSTQVENECLAVLQDRRQDAHFILATSGADIPLSTPPENIHAMRKAAESFGRIDI